MNWRVGNGTRRGGTGLGEGRNKDFEEDETRTLRGRKKDFEKEKKGNRESCDSIAVFR